MSAWLELLVRNSLEACLLAAAILLVKGIAGKRISPQMQYGIWGILMVKLAVPVRLSVPVRPMDAFYQLGIERVQETVSFGMPWAAANLEPPVVQQAADIVYHIWTAVFVGVYLTGVFVLLAVFAASTLRTARQLRRSGIQEQDGMRICRTDAYGSPFLFGFLRPVIVLPKACETAAMAESILAHEAVHAKRKDHWISTLLYLLRAVYWFNPLMWILCAKIRRDMEAACDATVVRNFSPAQKRDYATALVEVAGSHTPTAVAGFAEKQFRGRIQNILSVRTYKKTARNVALAVTAILFAGSFIGAGSAPPQLPQAYETALAQMVTARNLSPVDVESLVRALPAPDGFFQFDKLSWLGAESIGVSYGINEYESFHGAYLDSNLTCNAVLLFAAARHINEVTFVYNETENTYTRAALEAVYGDLYQKTKQELSQICHANRRIAEDRVHVDRVRLGSNRERIVSRWGEPSESLYPEPGVEHMVYIMPGASVTHPDGSIEEEPEEEIVCRLRDGFVFQIDTSGGAEFSYHLGINVDMSKKELVEVLGAPVKIKQNAYHYLTDQGRFVYFTFRGDTMVRLGLCES